MNFSVELAPRDAIRRAKRDKKVQRWVLENRGYLVSVYTETTGTIDYWNVSFYSTERGLAAIFRVSENVEFVGEEPIISKTKFPKKLELEGMVPIREAIKVVGSVLGGEKPKVMLSVQKPGRYRNPVLICNIFLPAVKVRSIWIDLKTGKLKKDKTEDMLR